MVFKAEVLKQPVRSIDGTEIKIYKQGEKSIEGKKDDSSFLSVREAFKAALVANFVDEQPTQNSNGISSDKKFNRYQLAYKIWNADGDIELSTEELMELKTCVGKHFVIEVLGYLFNVIENKK